MSKYRPIMIMGCTSDAGKSFLTAGLCRLFANHGIAVAPFKAQNMSNNAAVTPDGGEMGRAQYVQALAARITPQVRMNPVLLKPSADTFSQVIVNGKYDPDITQTAWMARMPKLWPVVREALHSLIADFDQVIIEGAGSPAEVNLRERDIVNMSVALECQADVYLVSDIDRGGSFAHLLGTFMCFSPEEQKLVKGFVLNKFRGDPTLLGNAMDWLKTRTGVPTVAIVPMLQHRLAEEDALHHRSLLKKDEKIVNIALIAYPYASNFDEFDPLLDEKGINLVPVREREALDDYEAIILPGSKNTAASLHYLRRSGLAGEITQAARRGKMILGVCGGMQMLGHVLHDPTGLEDGDIGGLGLLDLSTELLPNKVTKQCAAQWVDGGIVHGYEIHHGHTIAGNRAKPHLFALPSISEESPQNNENLDVSAALGWQQDNVVGVYLHDLLKNTAYRQSWLRTLGWQGQSFNWEALMDAELDQISAKIAQTGWFNHLLIGLKT
ncbi:MAG: cobyric acid synthase [Anaerolineae bacterium]|nr:cobyric acid synthase [Anaerolineae bacterium]